jgi:replicative DNA helicase
VTEVQPHDFEAERAVLAGCLMSRNVADEVMEIVKPGDFYAPKHEIIFTSIQRVIASGVPADSVSVVDDLLRRNQLNQAGGADYIHGVTDQIPIAMLAVHHANIVVDRATRRRLVEAATRTLSTVMTGEVSDLIESARRGLDEAVGQRRQALTYVGDLVDEVLAGTETPRELIPTPWFGLTDILGGGLRKGALYVIAARPGIGKTAIMLQLATMMASTGPVALSSLEMPKEELILRLISQGTHIPHHMLERGEPLGGEFRRRLDLWRDTTSSHAIAIDDRSSVTFADVRAHARAVQRTGGIIGGVAIDYLQLMSGAPGVPRQEVVSENARQAKLLARDLDAPVILLSQLNRESEKRVDRRPALSDLRESGAIEQDADVVILLYRDPDADGNPGGVPIPLPLEFMVAKNRHGPTANVEVNWEGSQFRAFDPGNAQYHL